jgi:hypothetical protein
MNGRRDFVLNVLQESHAMEKSRHPKGFEKEERC